VAVYNATAVHSKSLICSASHRESDRQCECEAVTSVWKTADE